MHIISIKKTCFKQTLKPKMWMGYVMIITYSLVTFLELIGPGDAIWRYNTSSGNGFMPDSINPFPEPMLTFNNQITLYSPQVNSSKKISMTKCIWKQDIEKKWHPYLPGTNELLGITCQKEGTVKSLILDAPNPNT